MLAAGKLEETRSGSLFTTPMFRGHGRSRGPTRSTTSGNNSLLWQKKNPNNFTTTPRPRDAGSGFPRWRRGERPGLPPNLANASAHHVPRPLDPGIGAAVVGARTYAAAPHTCRAGSSWGAPRPRGVGRGSGRQQQ